ncbi:hypothetical protein PRIPAC_76703 [Pristionchus pacificus]|uniref:Uncharacterized protein n=1 Tax=Pristionchus pacificus TaxID=54126 RepID=A0A2A6C5D4_PRIPA|nr:hypothetical protein PRIPAC_76703 [Pristionchus pacificus]|eukprot:PDM73308.1 hypothetical protein PRIPAC_40664 [Pristionchus pacificus]
MRHDQHYLESLEEDESEFLGLIESYEAEQEELLREQGRTSDKLQTELEQLKVSCGVYNRHYYANLIGEDARRLTRPENANRLWNLVEDANVGIYG